MRETSAVKIVAVIPARLGASRLARKPLRLLGGRPIVQRVWEQVSKMPGIDRVIVATDSTEVQSVCDEAGAETWLTRADHPTGTHRVAECLALAGVEPGATVVNVQGDEPFVSQEAVLGAASLVSGGSFALATCATGASLDEYRDPDVVKVVVGSTGAAMYFSRSPIPAVRDATGESALRDVILRHIGVYAYTRTALDRWIELPAHPLEELEKLEQLRPLCAGMAIGVAVVSSAGAAGIDTERDLVRANDHWNSQMVGRH